MSKTIYNTGQHGCDVKHYGLREKHLQLGQHFGQLTIKNLTRKKSHGLIN